MKIIEELKKQGKTIILITHDIHLAWNYAERLIIMKDGKIEIDGLTDSIINLLSNDDIIKSGVAINQDLIELQQIINFYPAGFIDLGDIARSKELPHHGLRGLAAYLLNFRISKSGRTSNWSANQLTKKQIKYAATDAWLGRELYLKYIQINVI